MFACFELKCRHLKRILQNASREAIAISRRIERVEFAKRRARDFVPLFVTFRAEVGHLVIMTSDAKCSCETGVALRKLFDVLI